MRYILKFISCFYFLLLICFANAQFENKVSWHEEDPFKPTEKSSVKQSRIIRTQFLGLDRILYQSNMS